MPIPFISSESSLNPRFPRFNLRLSAKAFVSRNLVILYLTVSLVQKSLMSIANILIVLYTHYILNCKNIAVSLVKQFKFKSTDWSKMKQYPLSADNFLFLAVGLARFLEEGKRYPYPSEFQRALHPLSCSLGDKYPKTITDLLHL